MKNLIFKEFKLSVHFLTYVLMALISLATLSGIGIFYPLCLFGCVYTFLFIGIKKGVTNNDLYYSLLLPVRRETVVKARILSTSVLQLIYTALIVIVSLIDMFIPKEYPYMSISLTQPFALLAICLISYTIFDLIYIPWFYKKGKEVIWNMLVGTITTAIISAGLCIIPTQFPLFFEMITVGKENSNYFLQICIFVFALSIYVLGKLAVLKISTKKLLKLDF